jgi:hypothetical protein
MTSNALRESPKYREDVVEEEEGGLYFICN